MPDHPGFDRFWTVWPPLGRKASRRECLNRWVFDECEKVADQIVAKVICEIATNPDWDQGSPAAPYRPAPLVWLNQQRWDDGGEALDWFLDRAVGTPERLWERLTAKTPLRWRQAIKPILSDLRDRNGGQEQTYKIGGV